MTAIDWNRRLASAQTAADVLRVVNEYGRTWTPERLADLPEECREQAFQAAEDVARFAVTLARRQLDTSVASRLSEMTRFYSEAARRLAAIAALDVAQGAHKAIGGREAEGA